MKSSTLAYVWGLCEFNGWFVEAMQVATTVSCLSTLPALPRALDNGSFLTNSWNAEMSKCMVSSSSPSVPSGMSWSSTWKRYCISSRWDPCRCGCRLCSRTFPSPQSFACTLHKRRDFSARCEGCLRCFRVHGHASEGFTSEALSIFQLPSW